MSPSGSIVLGGFGSPLLVTDGFGIPGLTVVPTGPQTDQVVFDSIVSLLQAINTFAAVRHGAENEILFPSADECPFVGIRPTSSTDVDTYDDGDYLRTTSYQLVIVVRDEDPRGRRSMLATLEAIVRNAIVRQPHGGFVFPGMSIVGPASWPKPRSPEQRIELTGSFTYEVITATSHDTTNTYLE